MVTAPEVYSHIRKVLTNGSIESAEFEAMCLTEHIFKKKLPQILMGHDTATKEQINYTDNLLYRRTQGEPLQYLLGSWEFYGLEFFVGKGVLIPRQDTETLIDTALSLKLPQNAKIVDLCSGSGCIAITMKTRFPQASVTAVEISDVAAGYINKNSELHHADIGLVMGDVLSPKTAEGFSGADLILCNPPYLTEKDMNELQREVTFEPRLALYGGEDGLDFYRQIIPLWKKTLSKDGVMAFETGMGQTADVAEIFKNNGFIDINIQNDLCGIDRVVTGRNGG